MGSQSEKDLIKNTDRPSLGRAFPPFNYQEGAFVGADVVSGRTPGPQNAVVSVWALKSGPSGDRLPGGDPSQPPSPVHSTQRYFLG